MNIFSRKRARQRADVTPTPAEITDELLAQVEAAVSDVEKVLATTSERIYPALHALAIACGARQLNQQQLVELEVQRPGAAGQILDRPWRQLGATVAYAMQQGDDSFPPRVCLLMLWWKARWNEARQQAERDRHPYHLQLQTDTLLGPPPDDASAGIATVALSSLTRLPSETVVAPLADEKVSAEMLLDACSRELVALNARGVSVEPQALQTARQLASG